MSKKLICFDYDNTIHTPNGIVPGTREKILSLKEKGNIIALDTARSEDGCRCAVKECGVEFDYYLGSNGTYVMDKNFKLIDNLKSTMGRFEGVSDILLRYNPNWVRRCYETELYQLEIENPTDVDGIIIGREEFDQSDAVIFIITCEFKSIDDAEKVVAELKEKFGPEPVIYNYGKIVDIMPEGAGKQYGIYKVMEMENISKDDVYAVGDSFPDLPMIENFHGSFLSYADPSLHHYAERIVSSVPEFIDNIPD